MSESNVNVQMSGNTAKLWQAMEKILQQQDKMDNKFKGIKSRSREADKELERFAKRTKEINSTPLEKYHRTVWNLDNALKKGLITQETYNRALVRAGTAAKGAVGPSVLARVAGLGAGFFGASAAVSAFSSALQKSHQELLDAVAETDRLTGARRRLLQVANGKGGGDNQVQNDQADALSAQYGMDRDASRQLIFAARSDGFVGSEANIARLVRANTVAPEAATTVAGLSAGLFDSTVTPEQALAGAGAASKYSNLDYETFAERLPAIAGGAKMVGSKPEETMAMLAIVAKQNARAGEYVATFAGQQMVRDPSLSTKGVMGIRDVLGGMPDAQRRKAIGGSKEANMAYQWLTTSKDQIMSLKKEIEAAGVNPEAYIAEAEHRAFDPTTAEGVKRKTQVIRDIQMRRNEIENERMNAVKGFEIESAQINVDRAMRYERASPARRWAAAQAMDWTAWFGGSPGVVQGIGMSMSGSGTNNMNAALGASGLLPDNSDTANNLREAAADLRQAAAEYRSSTQSNAATGVAE